MRLQLHQTMIADEEYKALKAERDRRAQQLSQHSTQDRSVCLLASISRQHKSHAADTDGDDVAGTLDLYAVKSVQGEVLIGTDYNAACTESLSNSAIISNAALVLQQLVLAVQQIEFAYVTLCKPALALMHEAQ